MRTAIAHSESQERLAEIAETAGMRSLVAAGLAKVRDGLVSAEELDRVLRFSE
jgi:type II secretory ATPase GspE/PulE/Tfp pilus assembly ATPase PilB-like protein